MQNRVFDADVEMSSCAVCHAEESRNELVAETFQIDGQYVLVDRIPSVVCARCGEQSFSRETTEKIRLLVHGEAKASKSIDMPVFEFA